MNHSENCPICQTSLNNTSQNGVYTMPNCEHKFHTDCIICWYQTQGTDTTCPMCRAPGGIVNYGTLPYFNRRGKIKYLKQYSRRKAAPEELKKMVDDFRKADKKYKEHSKKYTEFRKNNKEVLQELHKITHKKYNLYRQRIDKELMLAGYPLLQIPDKLLDIIDSSN